MPNQKRLLRNSSTLLEDKSRGIEDWKKLSTEMLRLKCNQYNLTQTGVKRTLINRLIDHLSIDESASAGPSTATEPPHVVTDVDFNTLPPTNNTTALAEELRELKNLVLTMRAEHNTANISTQASAQPWMAPPVMVPTDTSTSQHIFNNNNVPTASPSLPTLNSSSLISDNTITWNNAIVPATGNTRWQTRRNSTPFVTSLPIIEARLHQLLSTTLAPSTTRAYTSAFNTYLAFCQYHNFRASPPVEHTLLLFTSQLSLQYSYSHIKTNLAAIKHFLTLSGLNVFPHFPRLYMLTRAIKRLAKNKKAPRLPITIPVLEQLHHFLLRNYTPQDQLMLWAAFLMAFFGFLRSSEFVAPTIKTFLPTNTLLVSDVHFIDSHLQVHIKASKTDPFSQGCTVRLAPTKHNLICPVTVIKRFLQTHPTGTGPLFTYSDGTFLTRRRLNALLQKALPNTNESKTSSHSFRIGAATTAAASGMPRWLIQVLGRWTSDSFRTYIQIPQSTINWVAQSLAKKVLITATWDPDLS